MILTSASAPKKETVTRSKNRVIKQAYYEEVEGEQVLRPPVRENVEYTAEIYVVETSRGEITERHEFEEKARAQSFYEGFING